MRPALSVNLKCGENDVASEKQAVLPTQHIHESFAVYDQFQGQWKIDGLSPPYLGSSPDLGAPFEGGLCPGDALELAAAPTWPGPGSGLLLLQQGSKYALHDQLLLRASHAWSG